MDGLGGPCPLRREEVTVAGRHDTRASPMQ